jgi:hypothetical protein
LEPKYLLSGAVFYLLFNKTNSYFSLILDSEKDMIKKAKSSFFGGLIKRKIRRLVIY